MVFKIDSIVEYVIIFLFINLEQFPELHGLESQLHRLEAALKVNCSLLLLALS